MDQTHHVFTFTKSTRSRTHVQANAAAHMSVKKAPRLSIDLMDKTNIQGRRMVTVHWGPYPVLTSASFAGLTVHRRHPTRPTENRPARKRSETQSNHHLQCRPTSTVSAAQGCASVASATAPSESVLEARLPCIGWSTVVGTRGWGFLRVR